MEKLIIDGKDAVFGRMASFVAKQLLKGNSAEVINCEEIVISGDKNLFAKKIKAKKDMGSGGSLKGPKYIRKSDRLVKRMIRGMLPRDRNRGREAFKRLKCYDKLGPFKEEDLKSAKTFSHKIPSKNSTIKEIVGLLK